MSDQKSYWQKPENRVGALVGLGVIGALGWGVVSFYLPIVNFIARAAQDTTMMVVSLGMLAAVVAALSNKQLWMVAGYWYKDQIRKLVRKNPLANLRGRRAMFVERQENMRTHLETLKSQIRTQQRAIAEAVEAHKQAEREVVEYKKRNKAVEASIAQREVGRQAQSVAAFQECLRMTQRMIQRMEWIESICGALVKDITSEIKGWERKYAVLNAGYGAMQAAKRIMDGNRDEREIYDESIDELTTTFDQKMSSIDSFLDRVSQFTDGIDVSTGSFDASIAGEIEAWEQNDAVKLYGEVPQLTDQSASRVTIDVTAQPVSEYSRLLRR
jgi:hypothetical protein